MQVDFLHPLFNSGVVQLFAIICMSVIQSIKRCMMLLLLLLLPVQMLQYDIHSVPCFVLLEPGGAQQHAIHVCFGLLIFKTCAGSYGSSSIL
jgi:hypothetical protein